VSNVIYRASGVLDDGSAANLGTATVFHCTNYGKADTELRVILYNGTGVVVADMSLVVQNNITRSFSSHQTLAFEDYVWATPGPIKQGSAKIMSTSLNVACSGAVVPADAGIPQGTPLHLSRFNEASGQED
jgi:hypothetical protein